MKPEKVREMSKAEMEQKVRDLRSELLKLRFEGAAAPLKNPLRKRAVRKDIARLLTIMKEAK